MRQQLTRAALQRAVAVVLCTVLAGCSSSNPMGPSPDPGFDPAQFLRPGSYRLLVATTTPQTANCSGTLTPGAFLAIAAAVTVTRDGETWTARSTTEADGNLELRLRRVAASSGGGNPVLIVNVEGSGRGTATSTLGGFSTAQSLLFGGTGGESRLEGSALFQGSAQGTAVGTLTLNSPIFGTLECPAVAWTLSPALAPPS